MQPVTILALFAGTVAALSGRATTTRYYDGHKGACGCGTGDSAFGWQTGISQGVYTAAASQALYDGGGSSWCGSGCGKCYRLTSTGKAPAGQGTGGSTGTSIIVMVTNLCPYKDNRNWCPNPGASNNYGFQYHFDILSTGPVIGDNSIVDFESISCPGVASSDYGQCECHR